MMGGADAMSAEKRLEELQRRFAAHLRDPATAPAPEGIEDRRLQVYRELFFDNISASLAATFPVLREILGSERWMCLVRDFYRDHRCHTPLFLEIPREFVDYLGEEREAQPGDPAFLHELAHYEWVELALAVDEHELAKVSADPSCDLLEDVPVLSPLAWPLAYRFPVHRLGPDHQPSDPPDEPSFYIARRDRRDEVAVIQVNAVTLRLVERLQQDPELTGRTHLEALADELPQLEREVVLSGGEAALREMLEADVVLGVRPAHCDSPPG
jgi:hypothetical protein